MAHADIYSPTDRIYVAHTNNDSVDVIDCARDQYIESIPGLKAVAGALVSETRDLVFTSNRGENTVSVFAPCDAMRERVSEEALRTLAAVTLLRLGQFCLDHAPPILQGFHL